MNTEIRGGNFELLPVNCFFSLFFCALECAALLLPPKEGGSQERYSGCGQTVQRRGASADAGSGEAAFCPPASVGVQTGF